MYYVLHWGMYRINQTLHTDVPEVEQSPKIP